MSEGFEVSHIALNAVSADDFVLHNHNDMHEILLYIDGDSEFRVEGNQYKLKPYDLVLASNNELHKIVHLSLHKYERIVINIDTDFFVRNDCVRFSDIFESRGLGVNNYIESELVLSSGIYSSIERIVKYAKENEPDVAKCVLIELLYLLNKTVSNLNLSGYTSKHIRDIVAYINNNLTSELSLKILSEHFHLSSSHISRLFKDHMRMSIKKYIIHKRLILARELCLKGLSLLDASLESGFSNYSNFYRMYMKEFHHSPKKDLKI